MIALSVGLIDDEEVSTLLTLDIIGIDQGPEAS